MPQGVEPGALRYGIDKPDGDGNWALYDTATRPYLAGLTAKSFELGEPGLILDVPDLSFAVFPPGLLPPGPARIGIACTIGFDTRTYWDVGIELVADTAAGPAQFRWEVAPDEVDTPQGDGFNPAFVLLFGAFASGVAFFVVKRQTRSTSPNKE